MADNLIWTGDPQTQQYEQWLRSAMREDGKAMIVSYGEEVCLDLNDGGEIIRPGELISQDRIAAAERWFTIDVPKQH